MIRKTSLSRYVGKSTTPQYSLPYDRVPTVRGPIWGYSVDRYTSRDYSAILDCVYEMADMVASSNGGTIEESINRVLKDEDWYILPTHKKLIIKLLS